MPLPFLSFNENIAFKTYGALGNLSVDRFAAYGLPSSDYWYWQIALVTSAYGLDVMVAYTDTSIDPAGCEIKIGKPPGGVADCVLKTTPDIFMKIVREAYTPSPMEFMTGAVKSNDISLLQTFQKVFDLG